MTWANDEEIPNLIKVKSKQYYSNKRSLLFTYAIMCCELSFSYFCPNNDGRFN